MLLTPFLSHTFRENNKDSMKWANVHFKFCMMYNDGLCGHVVFVLNDIVWILYFHIFLFFLRQLSCYLSKFIMNISGFFCCFSLMWEVSFEVF